MAFFFRPHPIIAYRIPGKEQIVPVIDITRRFAITNFVKNAKVTFDEYYIEDGERPDTVAYDYYGDQSMDWLVLLTNEIQDPYFEWPLSYEQFNEYLRDKYGSVSVTQNTVHHYERILQTHQIITESGIQRIIPEKTLQVDYTTYAALPATSRRSVSVFDYENKLNDDRKHIYLIDLNYLQIIKDQHPYIFEEGSATR
jgi:hypothetical protein